MAIDARMSEREYTKFTESASVAEEVALKVVNPDGTDIGGGGGSSSVTLLAGTATAGKFYITDGTEDASVNASNELEVAETNSTAILSDTTGILADTTGVLADTTTIASDTTSLDDKITNQDGTYKNVRVGIYESNNRANVTVANADATNAGANGLLTNGRGYVFNGSTWDRQRGDTGATYTAPATRVDAIQETITSSDATSATQVVAKVGSKNIYITDVVISTDTALNVQLQDDASAVLMEQIYLPAVSVWSKTFSTPLMVATNQDLDVLASVAGNISVTVTGYQV